MSSPTFRLTPRALRDMEGIARYTRSKWGPAKCETYLRDLDARFGWLAEMPYSGRKRDEVVPDSRSFRQGGHVIFYRVRDRGIDIPAVVHGAMDTGSLS